MADKGNSSTGRFGHTFLQLLQLRTYPSTPEWQETDHIAKGRVKNSDLDETLIFRQVEFESMRMELASIGANENDSRPITIVTNNDSVRVVIKRRLSGKKSHFVLGSRGEISYSWTKRFSVAGGFLCSMSRNRQVQMKWHCKSVTEIWNLKNY